jgi:hypothetical protein
MNTIRRAALLGVLVIAWLAGSVSLPAVQEGAAVARPVLTPAQMEDFLLNAKIGQMKGVSKGVTAPRRATLSDGRITHDAKIQTVDIHMSVYEPVTGPKELNFIDSYRYNIAAYRVARLLGLDNVPMNVERRVDGTPASVEWWLDDFQMDENERFKKQGNSGMSTRGAAQIHIWRVFTALIEDTDANGGNLLWTKDGKMWMIDHTRAFRLDTKVKDPKPLQRCERGLLEAMRRLTIETVTREVGNSLTKFEIEALIARRNEIVKLFEGMIAKRGEGAILYTVAQP